MGTHQVTHSTWLLRLPLAGLILVYLVTRLTGLTVLPLSHMESVFIHWAQIVHDDPAQWLIITGSRPPLFVWLNAVALGLGSDPLAAGRWVSVLAGLVGMTGLYFIARDMFNRTTGFLAGLLYIVVPYAFFFDRLAVPEALLAALGVWILRWSLHIAEDRRPRKRAFILLGALIGAAFLTKAFAWILLPVPMLVFFFWQTHRSPGFWKQTGLAAALALAFNLPVLFSVIQMGLVGVRLYLFPVEEFLSFAKSSSGLAPADSSLLWLNFKWVRDYYVLYLTLPVVLVLGASVVYLFRERLRIERVLWLWLLMITLACPLVFLFAQSHIYLIAVPPVILLAAVACDRLAHFILITLRRLFGMPHHARTPQRAAAMTGFMLLVLFGGVTFDWMLMTDPRQAPLHETDRRFYLEGVFAGYGPREAARFLAKEAKVFHQREGYPLALLLPKTSGNPAEGVTVYLWRNPDVRRVPAHWWPDHPGLIPNDSKFSLHPSIYQTEPEVRLETRLLDHAYFVFPEENYPRRKFLEQNPRFREAWKFSHPVSEHSIVIYKNHPN